MPIPDQEPRLLPFLLIVVLCLAWLAPGLIGHQPWKGDEAETMGLVHSILSGAPAATPVLAGEPWIAAPPPFYALVAATIAQWLAPWLPAHDGARLAGGFFILLALIFSALTGNELYGHRHGRLVVLVMIGTVGLWFTAHESIPESALLCAEAMTGWGAALVPRRSLTGGMLAGTGLGMAFMSAGLVVATALALLLLLLPFVSPVWRTRATLRAAAMSVLFALPWFVLWPWMLVHSAPGWLAAWWQHQYQMFVFWAPGHETPTLYYLQFLPWFAWPAWPLAIWTVWQAHKRDQMTSPGIALPLAMWLVITLVMSCTRSPNPDHGLVLLPPLAWLAAGGTATLRRGAANALYWFAIMTFGVLAITAWIYWSALDVGFPAQLAQHLHQLQPEYQGTLHPMSVTLALAYCLFWLMLLARMKRSTQRPLMAWAAGMTLAWGLAAFLFVYPMDQRLGYQSMMRSLGPMLTDQSCVSGLDLDHGARAMLDYYLDVQTLHVRAPDDRSCRQLLAEEPGDTAAPARYPGWQLVWQGGRIGNHVERFALYRRAPSTRAHAMGHPSHGRD